MPCKNKLKPLPGANQDFFTPPAAEKTEKEPVWLSTLVGFIVMAGLIFAGWWFFFKPRYNLIILPKKETSLKFSPSPVQIKPKTAKPGVEQEAVSRDDNLLTIRHELDETTIDDFSEDFNQIKAVIDRL